MKKYLLAFVVMLSATMAHAIKFNVTVPEGTQKCYVVGAFNGWNPENALEMQQTGPTQFTLDAQEVTSVAGGFKYICGPSWTYVEKDADGMEVSNRTVATENDVVVRWAALYLPDLEMGSVTINATVPENTPENSVYIYGSFQEWIVTNALRMEMISQTQYTITIDGVTQFNYKLLTGKSEQYVEVNASGGDIPDRNAASNEPVAYIVVEAWKNVPKELVGVTYLENTVAFTPVSEKRNIWVYLPPDYGTNAEKHYPVMYMHDGQYVFSDQEGEGTWDVSETMNAMHAAGLDVGIVVAIDRSAAYIREYSPWENEVFSRTGDGDIYLQALINHVIPYINANYRTLTGPEHTAIAGSNMGGLISLYGGLKYQQYFGKVGVFSPFLWFNRLEISDFVSSWDRNESMRMHLSVGSPEGTTMNSDAEEMADLLAASGYDEASFRFEVFPGGKHENDSWAKQFRAVYSFLFDIPYEPDPDPDSDPDPDPNVLYQFMSHANGGVTCTGKEPFTLQKYYSTGIIDSETELHSYLKVIPVEFKSTWYWNINRGNDCRGENMFETNLSIGFSGSKAYESWFRVIIRDDESLVQAAASSAFFRVKLSDGTLVLMERTMADGAPGQDDTFTVSAGVDFPEGAKSFEVRFGSVNSGAVQGSLVGSSDSYPLSVGETVSRAQIIYNFRTNLVTINVLKRSEEPGVAYQFMSHANGGVTCTGQEPFTLQKYYPTGLIDSETELHSYLKVIPVEFKSTWYWNINRGNDCQGENLLGTNRSIGFSGSKAYESWFRVIIRDDESLIQAAASSAFFRVKTGDGLLTMMKRTREDGSPGEDDTYTMAADVEFPTANKNFEIRFGSVNTGSVQGSLLGSSDTYPLKVPDDWTKATILYNFMTNLVTIRENIDDTVLPALTKLMAVPPVTNAGTPVAVTAAVADQQSYSLEIEMSYNNGAFEIQEYIINDLGELEYTFTPDAGTYHIRLKAALGGNQDDLVFDGIVVRAGETPKPLMALEVDPYEKINWAATQRNKANFHLHTDWTSDASMSAHQVVDLYHSKGFRILPITNHNFSSYPWFLFSMFKTSWHDRDDQELDMITFPGNELSANNHHNDYFTGRNDSGADLEASFALTSELGGFQLLNHPGQYWSINTTYGPMQKNSPEWYADVFRRFGSIIGLEVYNQGNKHPNDRVLWDEILTLTMPERPVWGYSNDDAHHVNQAFFNYQFMLMETFDIPAVRKAMQVGTFYFSYEYGGTGNAMAPKIDQINVDKAARTITVDSPDGQVYWISGVDGEGSNRKSAVVGVGHTFVYNGFRGNYIRAFLKNRYGETGTQPFGFGEADVTRVDQIPDEITSVVVYPNPSKGMLYVTSGEELSDILLINAMGQVVNTYNAIGQTHFEIDMYGMRNGLYIISLRLKNKVVNKTIILNR